MVSMPQHHKVIGIGSIIFCGMAHDTIKVIFYHVLRADIAIRPPPVFTPLHSIEQIPKIHAGSVQQILNKRGIIGRVKVGAYALDTSTVGHQNLAAMCRLGSSDSASENPVEALRIDTIREILTTRHKPVLGTSFFLPATHVPPWREESAAEVIQGLQQSGTWGLGKSSD